MLAWKYANSLDKLKQQNEETCWHIKPNCGTTESLFKAAEMFIYSHYGHEHHSNLGFLKKLQ